MKEQLTVGYYFDIGNFKHRSIFDACTYVWEPLTKISAYLKNSKLGQIQTEIPTGAYIVNPESISIGRGTIVEPGAFIKGPCLIGEHCTIRHGAYIRGDLICGDSCVIGHDTEIKNVIMLNNAHAAHFAYLGDSIIGNDVNLGAGTKCANLLLNSGEISIYLKEERYPTHLRKLGAIIGDGCQIGCNVVTNPGTFIGKKTLCFPCLNVGGIIPSEQSVKSTTSLIISPR